MKPSPLPNISIELWNSRRLGLVALIATLLALLFSLWRMPVDESILADYAIEVEAFYGAYAALVGLAAGLFILEPRLRLWATQQPNADRVVMALALLVSFGVAQLVYHTQSQRLFLFPGTLWLLIVNTVGLSAACVWIVSPDPAALTSRHLSRTALMVLVILGVALIGLHVASVGEFMRLDVPDEPWLASMATNYAAHGALSPTFIASAYGTPDPALGRYYLLMGLWLRLLNDTSLIALRSFPLLVGAGAVLLFAAFLWRVPALTTVQRVAGIVTLLAMTAFVRTSHNLRMDIGLVVYSVVLLWGLVAFFDSAVPRRRWPLVMGLSFYIGLETVPTLTAPVAVLVGLAFVIWALPRLRERWSFVLLYASGGLAAVLLFAAGHFLPDPSAQWAGFQAFSDRYADETNFAEGRNVWSYLFDVQARFSLSLSPVELPASLLVLGLLWRQGQRASRMLVLIAAVQMMIMVAFLNTTFGYWVLFAPWVAYAVARVIGSAGWLKVMAFALLPAIISISIHDLSNAIQQQANTKTLAQTDTLVAQLPEDITLVGEPVFWFSLHPERTFLGWLGVSLTRTRHDLSSSAETLEWLDVSVAICWIEYESRCRRLDEDDSFTRKREFVVDGATYLIFER